MVVGVAVAAADGVPDGVDCEDCEDDFLPVRVSQREVILSVVLGGSDVGKKKTECTETVRFREIKAGSR